jgi:hypothetical protein
MRPSDQYFKGHQSRQIDLVQLSGLLSAGAIWINEPVYLLGRLLMVVIAYICSWNRARTKTFAVAVGLDVLAVSVGMGIAPIARDGTVRLGLAFAGSEITMQVVG